MSETTPHADVPPRPSTWLRDIGIVIALGCVIVGSAAGLAYVVLESSNSDVELHALKTEIDLFLLYRALREQGADEADWAEFERRMAAALPPLVKRLEPRASAKRPATQKLFWVAKYRLREAVSTRREDPSQAEEDCRHLLIDAAMILKHKIPDQLR